jgi:CPA2 family monovalent cation:H+ antiporter-2
MVGKGLLCGTLARLFGYRHVVPLAVGFGLCQIGEFSFVLAREGLRTASISPDLYSLVLATALVTMVLTPIATSAVTPLDALRKRWARQALLDAPPLPRAGLREHVVIAGGGRVGQYVATVLQRLGLACVIIELDQRRVEQCRAAGMPVFYGDASHPVVLEAAGVAQARLLMLTVPPITVAQAIVKYARQLAPNLPIVARAEGVDQMHSLHALGVDEVVQPEFEAGLEMVRQALLPLDIPPTEIERYTDAVRDELYAPLYQTPTEYQTLTQLRSAFHRLALTWVTVPDTSALVGHTIQALRLRSRTGATVVAVLRHGTVLLHPEPTYVFQAGDVVGVLGHTEQREAFQELAQQQHDNACSVPSGSQSQSEGEQ